MKKLLLIADFACHTGFATVAENVAPRLAGWQTHVIAINYKGDPHPLAQRFPLYPAFLGGDSQGLGRLPHIVPHVAPDAILIINDPWIVRHHAEVLAEIAPDIPVVAYMPVDGTSLRPADVTPLNTLTRAIAYTRFGLAELRRAGLTVEASVIPHGVDLRMFRPLDQAETRARFGLPVDMFGVLILDQNQVRKRLDIAFDAFARFAPTCPAARLIYHGPLLAEQGWDVLAMADDLGIGDRLILTQRRPGAITQTSGLRIEDMASVYALADVKLTTTSGEGWGFTTKEAMACGVPCALPDFGALGEWAIGAAYPMPATIPTRHAGGINTIGRVPDTEVVARALGALAANAPLRAELARRGLALVAQERYRWDVIAAQFDRVLEQSLRSPIARSIATRPGTIDAWVVRQVIDRNEYGIGELDADDLVIDVGAHIGAFSRLAHERGSRRIEAYEPDAANAEALRLNVAHLGIQTSLSAVWRSDGAPIGSVTFTGHDGKNTGAGNTVFGDGEQRQVTAVALDHIIGDRRVAVLKIDAESAEWPILYTSTKLGQVALIVGEYHEIGGAHDTNRIPDSLQGLSGFTGQDLCHYLDRLGFDVSITPYVLSTTGEPTNMGGFRAVRRMAPETIDIPARQEVPA